MHHIRRIILLLFLSIQVLSASATIDSVQITTSGTSICYDSCMGFAIVEVYASTSPGPFRIVWRGTSLPGQIIVDTTQSSDTIFDLCADEYSVEVQDLSDTTGIQPQNFTIANAQILSIAWAYSVLNCHNSLGTVAASPVGGTGPFHFQWNTAPNDTLNQLFNLPAGVYAVTITDNNGCTVVDSLKLLAPDTLKVNIGGTDVTCKGSCDGTAFANPTGGNQPYTYLWNNSQVNPLLSNLCPGNFIVTVTDDKNCMAVDSIEITEADSLKASFILDNPTCNADCDGHVTSTVVGGRRPFTYHWSGYNDVDSVLDNACAGLITTTVTDASGCYYTENITLTEPKKISILPTINASTCGVCDGDISIAVSGGSGNYHFLWLGQKAEDTLSTIDSLCPGIYQLALTDDSACTDTFSIVLSDDTSGIKDIVFTVSKASCADVCDGAVLASAIGGIAPYSYAWLPVVSTDSFLVGMCAGSYSVEITDASNCKRIELIDIDSESHLSATQQAVFNGCKGDCDSEISLTVSSGVAPYSYSWIGSSSTSSSASQLCEGSYPFKIMDHNGCVFRDTALIPSPDTIGISMLISPESCYNSCDASLSISISGGQAPYSIYWSTGQTSVSIGSLCAGSYWVDVTDAKGCIKRQVVELVRPSEISSNPVIYPADCGLNNGSIKLNPSGGVAPYSYLWLGSKSPSLGDSVGRLYSSFYEVQITDNNGCSKLDTIAVTNANGPTLDVVITDETCPGACDGVITLLAPGVNGPVQYTWSILGIADSINTLSGLCPGYYYVGILVDGCRSLKKVQIKNAISIDVGFDVIPPSCAGSCDASVVANISGGIPPYNISWSNSSTAKAVSGLCSGTYTIDIVDARGCFVSKEVTVTDPSAISVSLTTSNLICYNVCDGKISAAISGGAPPYTYRWSNGGNSSSADNLCAGNYWLEVTDANGCIGSDSIALGNGFPITASFNTTEAGCGQCNGSIIATAASGNGLPFSFLWSTGDTTNTASNLTAGIYTVEIKDNVGCSQEFTTTVSNIGGPATSDTSYGVSCNGSCDGSAVASAIGGATPYHFQWNDPLLQVGDSASGLCTGSYYYAVTDALGCISYDSVIVSEPDKITSAFSVTNISCPGDSNGVAQISISGGQPPYSVLWSNGDTTNISDSLPQGTYSVIITDTTGCVAHDTVVISDPTSISMSFDVTNTDCFGECEGLILASVTGGSKPYNYSWDDPLNQTTIMAVGLCSGYTGLTVSDNNACVAVDSALVNSPVSFTVTPTLSNPTCTDGDDGSIALLITGGTPPYKVNWDNRMTGSTITSLTEGTYFVTVIDANQCTYQNSYVLVNPTSPLSVVINKTNPSCNQGDGSISAIASGGSNSFSFMWNTIPAKTSASVTGLWAGIYELTVTDNVRGCTLTEQVILSNTGGPSLSFTVVDESCPGSCDGQVTASAGTGNFTFVWSPITQTDSVATNLCIGTYTVTVTDTTNGCITIDTVSVKTSDYVVNVLSTTPVNCYGNCDGNATIVALNGANPISYSWNTVPGQTTAQAIDLCEGIYIGTATDSLGCSASALVNIHEPDTISMDIQILNHAQCAGSCDGSATININGGTAPYTVYWNGVKGTQLGVGLCPGQNIVEVVDSKNCSKTDTLIILDVAPIMSNAVVLNPACAAYDGSIELNASGGSGPYFYQWSTGASTSSVYDLFAGIYTVVITDINGCSASFTFFLNNPNAPALSFDKNTVKCNGDCNGVARVTPIGGVPPFNYLWNHVPISNLDSLTELCSGTYFVKVTDASGCISFGSDTVLEPAVLDGSITKIADGCGGKCEGEAALNALGGTPPYTYSWNSSPAQTGSSAIDLCAGTVVVTVIDNNDCVYLDSIEITPPPELVIDSIIIKNASCFTNADGEASVYPSGGISPYTYLWSDFQTTQTIIGLSNGLLAIEITDQNNCMVLDTVSVAVQDTVLVTAFVDSFACVGDIINLNAVGYGATQFIWEEDSAGFRIPIGVGDSISYMIEDSVIIVLRGQNDLIPPCFDYDTTFVVGIPAPAIDAGLNVTIEQGSFTQLLASPFLFNGSYAWVPASSLNDSTVIDPIARPTVTTIYTVIGANEFGCFASDDVTVTVVDNDLVINGFSPNGDGVNDTWELPFLKDYPNVKVEVYNRWGIEVFSSDGYRSAWDGTYETELLPSASYYYVIDLFGDGREVKTGAVSILY